VKFKRCTQIKKALTVENQSHKHGERVMVICTQLHTKTLALGSQRYTVFTSEIRFCAIKQEVRYDYFQ